MQDARVNVGWRWDPGGMIRRLIPVICLEGGECRVADGRVPHEVQMKMAHFCCRARVKHLLDKMHGGI